MRSLETVWFAQRSFPFVFNNFLRHKNQQIIHPSTITLRVSYGVGIVHIRLACCKQEYVEE